MTQYCFVREAGLDSDSCGWVMKEDVVKKANSNLLFLEMNSTDVKGWIGNEDVGGSVQVVIQIPAFKDSIILKNLTYKSKGVHAVNSYGGTHPKKEYMEGELTLRGDRDNILISSSLNLITANPNTKQQINLKNNVIQSYSLDQYQAYANRVDSEREAEKNEFVNELTESIITRDSLSEIANNRTKDSLKLHPYKGKFRFWVSNVDKASYLRVTYAISSDFLIIKEGPYDFIYLAKDYSRDHIKFKRKLTENEKSWLSKIEQQIGSDSLERSYNNYCIMDGLILSFSFESAKFSKGVTVSNYYNEDIAKVIEFMNKICPKKYQIWYGKEELLKEQRECHLFDKER